MCRGLFMHERTKDMETTELKEIETFIQKKYVLANSELDEPEQAIANAMELFSIGIIVDMDNTVVSENYDSFPAYVSDDDDPSRSGLVFPDKPIMPIPEHLTKGTVYRVLAEKEYRRIKGQTDWQLYSIDFTDAIKVGD